MYQSLRPRPLRCLDAPNRTQTEFNYRPILFAQFLQHPFLIRHWQAGKMWLIIWNKQKQVRRHKQVKKTSMSDDFLWFLIISINFLIKLNTFDFWDQPKLPKAKSYQPKWKKTPPNGKSGFLPISKVKLRLFPTGKFFFPFGLVQRF